MPGRDRRTLLFRLAGVLVAGVLLLSAGQALAVRSTDRFVEASAGATQVAVPPRLRGQAEFDAVIARNTLPTIPAAAVTGLCRCVADHDHRHIGCLPSVDACKAACGEQYSFVPHAPSCPVTAQ